MKEIILFGAGEYGKYAVENYFQNIKNRIFFCDNDPRKQKKLLNGINIFGFAEIKKMYEEKDIDKIIITTCDINSILYQCISNEISIKDLFYYDKEKNSVFDICDAYSRSIYSQSGEEIYLIERFKNREKGIYIDVGANHPYRFSNTYWAYLRGWKGINIEPNKYNYELLKYIRSKDININCGVAETEREQEYYEFTESALNTFCIDKLSEKEDINNVVDIKKIKMQRLDSICKEHNINKVEFVDIDVEGMEIEVLKSINWNNIDIECILIEQRRMTLLDILKSEVCIFMMNKGYIPVTQYGQTIIYENKYSDKYDKGVWEK